MDGGIGSLVLLRHSDGSAVPLSARLAGAARGRCGPGAWRRRSADPPPASRHRPFPGSFAGKQTWPAREITRTLRTTWETTCRFCLVTSGTGAWPWVETEAPGRSRREDGDSLLGAAAIGQPLVRLARRSTALSSRPVSWAVGDVEATDVSFPRMGIPILFHLSPKQASLKMSWG